MTLICKRDDEQIDGDTSEILDSEHVEDLDQEEPLMDDALVEACVSDCYRDDVGDEDDVFLAPTASFFRAPLFLFLSC